MTGARIALGAAAALLTAVFAGCIGATGEASMRDLYGEALAEAKAWRPGALLHSAAALEHEHLRDLMGDDFEGAEWAPADDPQSGNGRAPFWVFFFIDPADGAGAEIVVSAEDESIVHSDLDDEGDEDGVGYEGFAWRLDSDSAMEKARANKTFRAAFGAIERPMVMLALGESEVDDDEAEPAIEADEDGGPGPVRAVWAFAAMPTPPMGDDHEDGEMESDHGHADGRSASTAAGSPSEEGEAWDDRVAVAIVDAMTGEVLAAGSFGHDEFDNDWGWNDWDMEYAAGEFGGNSVTNSGELTALSPDASYQMDVYPAGTMFEVALCYGERRPLGQVSFEVVGPDGSVRKEYAAASDGPAGLGFSAGEEGWQFYGAPEGLYTVNVRLVAGATADYTVRLTSGTPMEMDMDMATPVADC